MLRQFGKLILILFIGVLKALDVFVRLIQTITGEERRLRGQVRRMTEGRPPCVTAARWRRPSRMQSPAYTGRTTDEAQHARAQ